MTRGFTLVELSIVLVIIGLIIGGVLVGRDLITAASIRAQISQIEKYQAAVNTFRVKYGYLPGDIPNPAATQYGFVSRGSNAGQGDNNGMIEGDGGLGVVIYGGETEMFWVDLSTAKLIAGSFTQNNILGAPASVSLNQVGLYMPAAKIGRGNYVYVWSGGWQEMITASDGKNYFGLSAQVGSPPGNAGIPASNVTLTVQEAYNIEKKVDDGLPQSGKVIAWNASDVVISWAAGGSNDPVNGSGALGDYNSITGGPILSAGDIGDGMPAGPNSCYDGSAGLPEKYSMQINNGAGMNCALSFQFQ